MATQGLLSIIDKNTSEVFFKVIVGCNGYNIPYLFDLLSVKKDLTISDVFFAAKKVSVGCKRCLVVMDRNSAVGAIDNLNERYRMTFNNPHFNPRWIRGTADYIRVLEI